MSIPTYSPAQAATLIAVAQLQRLASRASNLFFDERCTRGADNLLRSFDPAPDPDACNSEDEIAAAIKVPIDGEPEIISDLRRRGLELAKKAITNVKKTLRRQFGCRSSQVPEVECNPAVDVENRLECQDLISMATPKQREVLGLRLIGFDDETIASELGVSIGNVAVLAHRGANLIRERLAARGMFDELAA